VLLTVLAYFQINALNKKSVWDVQICWSFTYLMLELALNLRGAINRFATLDKRYPLNPSK
jgi:hypothetical protein